METKKESVIREAERRRMAEIRHMDEQLRILRALPDALMELDYMRFVQNRVPSLLFRHIGANGWEESLAILRSLPLMTLSMTFGAYSPYGSPFVPDILTDDPDWSPDIACQDAGNVVVRLERDSAGITRRMMEAWLDLEVEERYVQILVELLYLPADLRCDVPGDTKQPWRRCIMSDKFEKAFPHFRPPEFYDLKKGSGVWYLYNDKQRNERKTNE